MHRRGYHTDHTESKLANFQHVTTNFLLILQGYRSNETCILTQLPLKETIVDFWRLIWDYQLKTIVMLNEIESDEKVS